MIIGSFAAGLVLARTGKGEEIEREVHEVAQFFVPIFFTVVGAAVDLRALNPLQAGPRRFLLIGLGLTAIGIIGKVAAGYVALQPGLRRGVIGVGMIPRGEVGLIFAQIGLTASLLSSGLYSAVALMVMATTFVTPPLLRRLLHRAEERDELHGESDYVVDAPLSDERRRAVRKRGGGSPDTADRPPSPTSAPSD
jgi:Kef-type K+ transport system membrane component KefB